MLVARDRGVGRVMAELKAQSLDSNVSTSDNGSPPYINRPYRGWKVTYFEGGIHALFGICGPAQIASGRTSLVPVSCFDLFGMAAAAADATLPAVHVIDGVNLLPWAWVRLAANPIRRCSYYDVRTCG